MERRIEQTIAARVAAEMTSDKVLRLIEDRIKQKAQMGIRDEDAAATQREEEERRKEQVEHSKWEREKKQRSLANEIAREEEVRLVELQTVAAKRDAERKQREEANVAEKAEKSEARAEQSLVANRGGKARPKLAFGLAGKKK